MRNDVLASPAPVIREAGRRWHACRKATTRAAEKVSLIPSFPENSNSDSHLLHKLLRKFSTTASRLGRTRGPGRV